MLFKSNHRHEVNIFSFVSISQNIKSVLEYEYNRNFIFSLLVNILFISENPETVLLVYHTGL